MDTGLDNVGLAVLPPATNTCAACAKPASDGSNYNNVNAAYVVVPLTNTYGTMNNGNITLNHNSPLLQTINCVQADGETAYATALDAGQAPSSTKDGRPGVQKVIIILSDGAANTGPGYLNSNSPYRAQPCHRPSTRPPQARQPRC